MRSADLAALALTLIWGTGFVIQKVALEQIPALPFTCFRFMGMLALAWAVVIIRRRGNLRELRFRREDFALIALAGVLGYTLYITLSTVGLTYTTAFSNALLVAVAPICAVVISACLRIEPVRPRQWLGLAVAVGGIALFVSQALAAGAHSAAIGDAISLVAATGFAAYTVCNKPLLQRYPLDLIIASTLTVGALPVIALALPATLHVAWSHVSAPAWGALLWSTIVPVYVAWTVWAWVIGRIGVARTALYLYVVPLVGGVTSWLVLGESFGPEKLIGGAVVLAGVALARRGEQESRPAPRAAARRLACAPRERRSSLRHVIDAEDPFP
ncbi:MAG TPA: DMT family transporter [Candidatus Dormibacteraeota bacterium]|nr:DMT family transporter [Candidatus Dormibacteraeota bacterium]